MTIPDYIKAGLLSLGLAVICIPLLIPVLRRLGFGQYIREDGPGSHLSKSGTPTMGGIVFLLTIPTAVFFTGRPTTEGLLAIFLVLAMGLLGFLDDLLKIRGHHSEGLTSRQKMVGQMVVALLFSAALWWIQGGRVWLPLVNTYIDFGLLYVPAAVFVIISTANGVNFTDGIDGLCSGVTFLVAVAFLLLCRAWGLLQLTSLAGALAGSCLGFLLFNLHPARVFMGDTGALALGGAVAALALLSDTALLLPLLGIIYVAEVASVILQVTWFRMTGGKRLFRMSPLHHHFELGGWKESRIDLVFWAVSVCAAMLFLWVAI